MGDPDAGDDAESTGSAERVYHVDGELVPAAEATVHVEDRGFAYGDAAFETLRAYGGDVFRWEAHADRLADTCETLALDHGLSDADLNARIDETLAANDLADAYVKCSITRGRQPGTLDPQPDIDPTVVVSSNRFRAGASAPSPPTTAPRRSRRRRPERYRTARSRRPRRPTTTSTGSSPDSNSA